MIFRKFFGPLVLALKLITPGTGLALSSPHVFEQQWALSDSSRPQPVELNFTDYFLIPSREAEHLNLPSPKVQPIKRPIVAVLDTGLDRDHPSFQGRIVQPLEASFGWPNMRDPDGHGTHIAGIITEGCSAHAKILPLAVIDSGPNEPIKPLSQGGGGMRQASPPPPPPGAPPPSPRGGLANRVAHGIAFAVSSGADIINLSIGWPELADSEFLREAVAEALRQGVLVIAAAGNDATEALLRPCSYPGVICVGAHGPDGALSHFSNFGAGVDLAAPGLNILSALPVSMRPSRFRPHYGYEFKNGTSQATAFVSCLAAEMIARGVPAEEVYPRLLLGARPHQRPLPLLSLFDVDDSRALEVPSRAFSRSGNADLKRSLEVRPQPLILPVKKEPHLLLWEEGQTELTLDIELKNYWQPMAFSPRVQAEVVIEPGQDPSIRPLVRHIHWVGNAVRLKLTMPPHRGVSELTLRFEVAGSRLPFFQQVILLQPVSKSNPHSQAQLLAIPSRPLPQIRLGESLSLQPVVQNLDPHFHGQDYVQILRQSHQWTLWLFRQTSPLPNSDFQVLGPVTIPTPRPANVPGRVLTNVLMRTNWGYAFDFRFEPSEGGDPSHLQYSLFYFNSNFELTHQQSISGQSVRGIPYQVNTQIQWMTLGSERVPTWLGPGERVNFLVDSRIESVELPARSFAVHLLSPSHEQVAKGRVPVLIGQQERPSRQPTYINRFFIAELGNGQVKELIELETDPSSPYFNYLQSRSDAIMALHPSASASLFWPGSFFFAQGRLGEQSLSALVQSQKGPSFFSQQHEISATRGLVDAVLWVRQAYYGIEGLKAFSLTNTEVQFNDFGRNLKASTSQNRYSFLGSSTIDLQTPLVVGHSQRPGQALPALFTGERSQFNPGLRFVVPHYFKDQQGDRVELVAPAQLRFQRAEGCDPLDEPFWSRAEAKSFVDYDCGDFIQRIPLSY